ncbi:MAG: hypothetical protein J5973_00395, partial [Eubacterium sp.]|nr:hypothetical protein [Eubacterium sp.]
EREKKMKSTWIRKTMAIVLTAACMATAVPAAAAEEVPAAETAGTPEAAALPAETEQQAEIAAEETVFAAGAEAVADEAEQPAAQTESAEAAAAAEADAPAKVAAPTKADAATETAAPTVTDTPAEADVSAVTEEAEAEAAEPEEELEQAPEETETPVVTYSTHVQTFGWQDPVTNGEVSGTEGLSKRLEGIRISVSGVEGLGIEYRTHVQKYGWQGWKKNGAMSGTSGEAKRLEAIDIRLTGEMANHYDVYYRVHAQSFGWLNWAKNGQSAGTAGFGKRLEGIQIVLVEKGKAAPGNLNGVTSVKDLPFYDKTNTSLFEIDGAYAGIEANMKLNGSGSGYHAKINIHDAHGVAVSFGIQYEYNLSRQYPNITGNNTAFLVENVMSHATQAGHQGKNYHFIRSANLGQDYKVAFSWYKDNSLRFYVNGEEIYRTSTTLTPPLFFQVEGSCMKNGDTINAQFSNVRVKCGSSPYYGIWADWGDKDFDFFGLDAKVTKKGTVVDNGQWSTNGWASYGISATVTGTARIGGGADWDTCFSQVEPKTGQRGLPLSGIVMIASKEAAYS